MNFEPMICCCGICGKKSVFGARKYRLSLKPGLSREDALRRGVEIEYYSHTLNEPTTTEIESPDDRSVCPHCGASGVNLTLMKSCRWLSGGIDPFVQYLLCNKIFLYVERG